MKATILAIAALVTIAFSPVASYAQSAEKLNPGDGIPGMDISMKNVNGGTTNLQNSIGENGLLVMFSCNTCPFVIKNQPITAKAMKLAAAYKVNMVIVNSNEAKRDGDDSYDAMKKYAQAQNYTVPYVIDESSKLADLFGANHTPEVFLFNSKGKLVYKGAMNDNPSSPDSYKVFYLENAIKATAGGMEVNPKTTKSIGCSIKRKA